MQQAELFAQPSPDVYAAIAAADDWVWPSDIRRAVGYGRHDLELALDALVESGAVEEGRFYFGTERPGKGYLGFHHIYRANPQEAA